MKKIKIALTILTLFTLVGCEDKISPTDSNSTISSNLNSNISSNSGTSETISSVTPVAPKALDTTFATKLKTSIKSLTSVTAVSETLSNVSFETSANGSYTKTYLTADGLTDTTKGNNGVETVVNGTTSVKINDVKFKQAYSGFDKTDSKDLACSITSSADYDVKYNLTDYSTSPSGVYSDEFTENDLSYALYLDKNVVYADLANETIHNGLVDIAKEIILEYIENLEDDNDDTEEDDSEINPTGLDDSTGVPTSPEEIAETMANSLVPNYASFNLANEYYDLTETINEYLPLNEYITMDNDAVDEYIDQFMDIYNSLTTINSFLTYTSDETYTYLHVNLTTNLLRLLPTALNTYISSSTSIDDDTKETIETVCEYAQTLVNATTINTFDVTVAFNNSGFAYVIGDIDISIANYKQEIEYVSDSTTSTYYKSYLEIKSGKIDLEFKDTYTYNSNVVVEKHGNNQYTDLSSLLPFIITFLG